MWHLAGGTNQGWLLKSYLRTNEKAYQLISFIEKAYRNIVYLELRDAFQLKLVSSVAH